MVDLTLLKRKKYGGLPRHTPGFFMGAKAQEERTATMLRILPGLGASTYFGH
jgi:hypothetical protein